MSWWAVLKAAVNKDDLQINHCWSSGHKSRFCAVVGSETWLVLIIYIVTWKVSVQLFLNQIFLNMSLKKANSKRNMSSSISNLT